MKKVKSLCRSLWHLKRKSLFKTSNIKLLSRRPDGCVIIVVDMVTSNLIATSYVTFSDRAKGKIKGIGRLCRAGSSHLDDVLLVEGLTTNLISISQLCDQG